jgi:hypothetical protein
MFQFGGAAITAVVISNTGNTARIIFEFIFLFLLVLFFETIFYLIDELRIRRKSH